MASNLSASEIFKYGWRTDKFIEKYKSQEPFLTTKNEKVIFAVQKSVIDILNSSDRAAATKLCLIEDTAKGMKGLPRSFKLSDLAKTEEFGGRSVKGGAGVGNEAFLVSVLNSIIGKTPIDVVFKAGNKKFIIEKVEKVDSAGTDTSNAKKSDINFITDKKHHTPISLKQDDAGGWESSDTLFREPGKKLLAELEKRQIVERKQEGQNFVLNRVIAMEATTAEKELTVFGSDIKQYGGAVIVRTFKRGDITFNEQTNQIEIVVSYIFTELKDIPDDKQPIWVIRNQGGRKSLGPDFPGLRTEMKIKKYAKTERAAAGRKVPYIVSLNERRELGLGADIVRL